MKTYTEQYLNEERQKDSGFYKTDPTSGELLYGRFYVLNKDYELWRDEKDTYTYPTDGWYWINSEAEAKVFFNIIEESEDGQL